MSIAAIDLVFFILIAVVTITITVKGFIAEILGKASFVLGLLLAIMFYDDLGLTLSRYMPLVIAKIASFIVIFILVFLVFKCLQTILQNVLSGEILGSLDKALGFFLGLIESVLITAVIFYILTIQPFVDMQETFSKSFLYKLLSPIINPATNYINNIELVFYSIKSTWIV